VVSIVYIQFFTEKATDVSKNKENLTEIGIDTLFNEKEYLVIGKSNDIKLVKVEDTVKHKGFYIAETYKDDAILAKNEDKDNLEVFRKFSTQSYFDKYEVPVYDGKLVDPDFASNPDAKMFKTRITEGCKNGINFAGHSTLIYWGCGTSCQYGVVVNRKTGKIIDGYQSSLGSEFKKDSEFIILNSDVIEENAKYIPLYQLKKFELKVWKNNEFKDLD
jgi:hypothetical protein